MQAFFNRVHNLARTLGSPLDVLQSERSALLKRSYKKHCKALLRVRVPITVWVLAAMLSPGMLDVGDDVFFAVCCVGVFGLLRGGELTFKSQSPGCSHAPM